VDDTKLMQESAGNFMANEARKAIESPQNYGFTSVVMDAEKDAKGKITACAESFVSFMGGNRSFPVFGNMDDRRHRLQNLAKGDTAMFRTKQDKQQFHMSTDGGFWTAPRDKTVRMHLLDEDSDQQQSQSSSGAGLLDTTGGSSGSSQAGQKNGQQARYKDGQKTFRFVDVTKDKTRVSGTECHLMLADGNTYVHVNSDNNVYLGGKAGSGTFDMLVTVSGPCVNSKGKK
jgi:phage gp45-like